MIRQIKEIAREKALRTVAAHSVRDDEGRGIITMTVRDDSDFLSPYSENNAEVISPEVAGFLSDSAMPFHPGDGLALHIYSDCIDSREREIYTRAIRNHYTLQAVANERELGRNTLASAAMAAIGVLGLVGMIAAEHLGSSQILIECIDIFAWVFLWEAVDLFFMQREVLRMKKRRIDALRTIKVKYFSKNAKENEDWEQSKSCMNIS